jgi:hypothetical protein
MRKRQRLEMTANGGSLSLKKKVPDKEILLIKSFCGGPGGGFYKKSPLVAEGVVKK